MNVSNVTMIALGTFSYSNLGLLIADCTAGKCLKKTRTA